MRIGFDAKRLFNNFTGLGNYSRYIVQALLDNYPDHYYTLYSPKVKQHPDTKEFRVNPKLLVRTPPRWVKGSGFGSFWRSVNLGNIAFRDGMDIFHGLSNELPVSKPNGLKTVVTVHDLIFMRYPELYSAVDGRIYKNKLKRACNTADAIIAISEQTARDLNEYMQVPRERIKVIYQGCNAIFKQKSTPEEIKATKSKYNLPEKYILSVGTLEPRKNALLLLEAISRLDSNHSVVLVGRATSYQQQLESFISANNLSARVHFIHKAEFSDLPAIYQEADLFVYPSRFEGFGIPIVEAIHSRIPVIAATGSCLEEAGGPSCVYVSPDDPQALADEIKKLISDQLQREQMIEDALQHVQQFEPQAIAADHFKVYAEVLG